MKQEIKKVLQDLKLMGLEKGSFIHILDHKTNKYVAKLDKQGRLYTKNTKISNVSSFINGRWCVTTEPVKELKETLKMLLKQNKQNVRSEEYVFVLGSLSKASRK